MDATERLVCRRLAVWATMAVLGLVGILPAPVAKALPSYRSRIWPIVLSGPSIAADSVVVRWTWAPKTGLVAGDRAEMQWLVRGRWRTLSASLTIGMRSFGWNTSRLNPDDTRQYTLRLVVPGKGLKSHDWRVWVDHVSPVVWITAPLALSTDANGDPIAIAFGKTELRVQGSDFPFGLAGWVWEIEGPIWTTTSDRFDYDFGSPPGLYKVTAIANDRAGNHARSKTITVLGLPGP